MSRVRRVFVLGIAVVVAFVAGGYGDAQTQRQRSPGYVEIPVDGDFEQILKSLLAQVQSSEEFGDQLKRLIEKLKKDPDLLEKDSDEIERLKQRLGNENPILRQRLQQWLKQGQGGGNGGVAIDPEKLAEFQKRLQSIQKAKGSRGGNGGGNVDPPPVPPRFDPDIRPPQEEPPGPEDVAESESPWQKLLKEWGQTLAKSDFLKSLGESESFQQLAMDFNELLSGGDGGDWLGDSEDWSGWRELFGGDYWDQQAEWLGGMGAGEMFAFAKPSMNGLAAVDAQGLDRAGSALVAVALAIPLAAVVVIVGIYLFKRMGVSDLLARKQRAAILGPWPVDPRRLASPEEVVVAFNYVTLLLCGLEAESWNHKRAVENLGRLKSSINLVPLAHLYEKYRYDEADEWSPRDIESARQLLCQLAGG